MTGRRACLLISQSKSFDFKPLNFFYWMHTKSSVYDAPVVTEEEIVARIVVATVDILAMPGTLERVRQSLGRRCPICINVDYNYENVVISKF